MLGKIIKYEFKATSKNYIISFLAVIALALMSGMAQYLPEDIELFRVLKSMVFIAYVAVLCMMPTAVMIALGIRFYKTMLCDNAYFTHTIPVKKKTLINGKLLSGTIWMILSVIIVVLSVVLLLIVSGFREDMMEVIREIMDLIKVITDDSGYILTIILGICLAIVFAFVTVIHVYASVGMGQVFNSHKKIGAVVFYVILRYVSSIVMSVAMYMSFVVFDMKDSRFETAGELNVLLTLLIVFEALFGVICYAITYVKFNRFDLD